jgi:hypothetical protein
MIASVSLPPDCLSRFAKEIRYDQWDRNIDCGGYVRIFLISVTSHATIDQFNGTPMAECDPKT